MRTPSSALQRRRLHLPTKITKSNQRRIAGSLKAELSDLRNSSN